MTRIAAVILAGGRGERLGGVNKALLEIGGRRLIDHAAETVADCDPVLLSVGRSDFTARDMVAVRDLDTDYAGPLAGVAAAVEHLRDMPADLLLSLAVDTPFFPRDFAERGRALLEGHDVVLGAYAGQDYPTNALWRLETLRGLPGALRAGTAPHSLNRLAERLHTARLDYAALSDEDPFANANTPEDMAILEARAARK
jgi:molybdopterin-guanine dinucleotide biosynthesis protein A